MNRKNIKKVRDAIAAVERKRFDMRLWTIGTDDPRDLVHNCNTAGCIGGWTEGVLLKGRKDCRDARELLGLTDDEAGELFYAWNGPALRGITQAHAVRVLDHLLETGEVDWKSTRRAKKAAAT